MGVTLGLGYYPWPLPDYIPVPTADHLHERSHQHQNFWHYLTRQHPDAKLHPNCPDVDLFDNLTYYIVEVEVPGVKDAKQIKCWWTSPNDLEISGDNTSQDRNNDLRGPKNVEGGTPPLWHHASTTEPPYSIIAERRRGPFRRWLTFPSDSVEPDTMHAKLEAGCLTLKIAKKKHHHPHGDGRVKVEQSK